MPCARRRCLRLLGASHALAAPDMRSTAARRAHAGRRAACCRRRCSVRLATAAYAGPRGLIETTLLRPRDAHRPPDASPTMLSRGASAEGSASAAQPSSTLDAGWPCSRPEPCLKIAGWALAAAALQLQLEAAQGCAAALAPTAAQRSCFEHSSHAARSRGRSVNWPWAGGCACVTIATLPRLRWLACARASGDLTAPRASARRACWPRCSCRGPDMRWSWPRRPGAALRRRSAAPSLARCSPEAGAQDRG